MTRAAGKFIGQVTLQALTGRKVYRSLWDAETQYDPQHICLTEAADLFVVAPATANILGKVAGGLADDLVSTMIMAADCPVIFAPTMNSRMWANPIVQDNVAKLRRFNYGLIEPQEGWLACRTVGAGRIRWAYVRVIHEAKPTGSVEAGAFAEGTIGDRTIEVNYRDPGDRSEAVIRLTRAE
jgi:phosphopantothenoylcysteine decarboxylase/phosphopantothenate--cysteine ligase